MKGVLVAATLLVTSAGLMGQSAPVPAGSTHAGTDHAVPAQSPPSYSGSAPADVLPVASAPAAVTVALDRTVADATLGGTFSFDATVRNESAQPVSGLIAHLNVLSSDPSVYVDPEDWSSHRSQFLDVLPAHSSATLRWPVQAVTAGPAIVYVAVTDPAAKTVAVSGPLQVTVPQRATINAGGIVPLALGIPAVVLALLVFTALRRRHLR